VSSILTQFFCVAGIAIRSYLLVVRKYDLAVRLALKITASVWVTCIVLTGLFSLFSPIYLMSNGTYCFFGFSSFAIAGWLLPGLVLALGVMTVCYYKIWKEFKKTTAIMETALRILRRKSEMTDPETEIDLETPGDMSSPPKKAPSTFLRSFTENARRDISHVHVARRSALFIAVLLLGWGFAAVTAIFELTVGHATEWLVTAVGVGGVSHSWWVPIMYAYTSEFHKKTMKKLFGWICVPCRGKAWWQEALGTKKTSSQESTMGSTSSAAVSSSQSSQDGSRSPVYTSQRNRQSRSASASFVRPPPPAAITTEIQVELSPTHPVEVALTEPT